MSSYISSLVHFYLSRAGFFAATRSPVAAAASNKTSSSKAHVHTGEKLFKVVGHSLIDDRRISECFSVGGHDWAVCYYPNGVVGGRSTSLFLALMSDCKSNKVKTSFTFSLQHPVSPAASWNKSLTCSFSSKGACQGHPNFVSKDDLTAFGYLKDDDCLVIKCSLQVTTTTGNHHRNKHNDDDIRSSIVVPPSNLSTDLRDLFERGHKADLSIRVGGGFRTFKVHGCMLAARSPVFRALLCGSMTESRQSSLDIDDMDADVFEALLYYIYNDRLPEFMEDETTEEATDMAQHLLVAADRYGVERLKLICESKLSKALDVNTVCSILDLAEQYSCLQLKAHSLKYIEMECKRLGAIEETEGFKQLKSNHPLLARDILAKARRCRKNGQKRKKSKNNKLRKK